MCITNVICYWKFFCGKTYYSYTERFVFFKEMAISELFDSWARKYSAMIPINLYHLLIESVPIQRDPIYHDITHYIIFTAEHKPAFELWLSNEGILENIERVIADGWRWLGFRDVYSHFVNTSYTTHHKTSHTKSNTKTVALKQSQNTPFNIMKHY